MGKNAQIHLYLETDLHEALLREAKEDDVSISEICRRKLKKNTQLTRIELRLENIEKKLSGSKQ